MRVNALDIAARKPPTARTEAEEFFLFARRILRACARRTGDRDIAALTGLSMLRDEVDQALGSAVVALHGQGYSWTEIGMALGTTRQAAQQRFGKLVNA